MIISAERVLYRSDDGYMVILSSTDDELSGIMPERPRVKRFKNGLTLVLKDSSCAGEEIETGKIYSVSGKWIQSKKYGKQFEVESCSRIVGESQDEIVEYFREFKGIGHVLAKRIYKMFGPEAVLILKTRPEEFKRIKGMSDEKIANMTAMLAEVESYRRVHDFFSEVNFSAKKIKSIYSCWRDTSIDIAKSNPYDLCTKTPGVDEDYELVGFKDAEAIALKYGVALDSHKRIRFAIMYAIGFAMRQTGDLYISWNTIVDLCLKILNAGGINYKTDRQRLTEEMKALQEANTVKAIKGKDGKVCFYFQEYFNYEQSAAHRLSMFIKQESSLIPESVLDAEITECESDVGFILDKKQRSAIKAALNSGISVITGGPGTGKSTILSVLIKVLEKHNAHNILLCSPTGRAARRIAETTGRQDASTIHSLLGLRAGEQPTDEINNSISADALIVDEASMLDMELAYNLFRAVTTDSRIILVGDADQLPSVGPGNVLRELIKSECIPVTFLDVIYRQSGKSLIVSNSDKIRRGKIDYEFAEDFVFNKMTSPDEITAAIKEKYLAELKINNGNMDAVQILSPFKTLRMPCSTTAINTAIQASVNPVSSGEIRINGSFLRVGDRVIQQTNNESAKNGDIGKIVAIYKGNDGEPMFDVKYPDSRISYTKTEAEESGIALAYAITVHKSQGSEFNTVIIPLLPEYSRLLYRNLIYTAVTRAKKKVVFFGSLSVLQTSCMKDVPERKTLLAERIKTKIKN